MPGSGRFMTADPYHASAGAADPGSWNRYAYVVGDPINNNDPSGLASCNVSALNTFEDPQAPLAAAMIWCTSTAGSVQQFTWRWFNHAPTDGELAEAMRVFGSQVDANETNAFRAAIEASRQRVLKSLTDSCARSIGAANAAEGQAQLLLSTLSLSDPGPLRVTTNAQGAITAITEGQYLAQYSRASGIEFNKFINWTSPSMTLAVNQNGVTTLYDAVSAKAFQVGAASMTSDQFVDLVLLHELGHAFGQSHAPDAKVYNTTIWTECFK